MTERSEGMDVPLERRVGGADPYCSFIDGNEPCSICPRRISALHMCKLLQDELAECLDEMRK